MALSAALLSLNICVVEYLIERVFLLIVFNLHYFVQTDVPPSKPPLSGSNQAGNTSSFIPQQQQHGSLARPIGDAPKVWIFIYSEVVYINVAMGYRSTWRYFRLTKFNWQLT